MGTRVLLVDDQKLFLEGLNLLLQSRADTTIVGQVHSGADAIDMALKSRPDLILIDVLMPGINGIEAVRSIRTNLKSCRIIALSSFVEKGTVLQMLKAGANGYVLKANAFSELIFAIEAVLKGNTFLSPEVSGLVVEGALDPHEDSPLARTLDVLTSRERLVLQLLCEDQVPKEIAQKLGISRKTVDVHKRNLMEKLGVSTAAGLFRLANREGLI